MSHVTYEWGIAHMNESRHICMSHVTYEWVMSHMNWLKGKLKQYKLAFPSFYRHPNQASVIYEWVVSRTYKWASCHMNSKSHVQISYVTYESVMSHVWLSWVTYELLISRMKKSSRIKSRHGACHTRIRRVAEEPVTTHSCVSWRIHTWNDSFIQVLMWHNTMPY